MMRQLWAGISVFVLLVPAALGQALPTNPRYYEVFGVAADDVLNIRAEPDVSSEIVGSLAPDAHPVEVMTIENGWAHLSAGEMMGWASASYLAETDYPSIDNSILPDGMVCVGTEPFWSLSLSGGQALFHGIDLPGATMNISQAQPFGGAGPHRNFVLAVGEGQNLTAITSNELCSDGMSDRDYPRRVDLVFTGAMETSGYTGCCYLPVP